MQKCHRGNCLRFLKSKVAQTFTHTKFILNLKWHVSSTKSLVFMSDSDGYNICLEILVLFINLYINSKSKY